MQLQKRRQIGRRVPRDPILLRPSAQEYFRSFTRHRRLLADTVRLDAFRCAISEVVRPGDIVMDIGAGTGVLSEYALQAGALRVHLVEENDTILAIARDCLTRNWSPRRFRLHSGRSTDLRASDIEEPVDVIVSETLGTLGINEGIASVLLDASNRFLRPGGRCIPADVALFVASCRLNAAERRGHRTISVVRSPMSWLNLGRACTIGRFGLPTKSLIRFEAKVSIPCDGPQDGLCFWMESKLSTKVVLSAAPTAAPTSFGQALVALPLPDGYVDLRLRFLEGNHSLGYPGLYTDMELRTSKRTIFHSSAWQPFTLKAGLLMSDADQQLDVTFPIKEL